MGKFAICIYWRVFYLWMVWILFWLEWWNKVFKVQQWKQWDQVQFVCQDNDVFTVAKFELNSENKGLQKISYGAFINDVTMANVKNTCLFLGVGLFG